MKKANISLPEKRYIIETIEDSLLKTWNGNLKPVSLFWINLKRVSFHLNEKQTAKSVIKDIY